MCEPYLDFIYSTVVARCTKSQFLSATAAYLYTWVEVQEFGKYFLGITTEIFCHTIHTSVPLKLKNKRSLISYNRIYSILNGSK